MAEAVRCLECGLEVPVGKRICPTCQAPQPLNRKGYIVVGGVLFGLMLVAWIAMQIFGK